MFYIILQGYGFSSGHIRMWDLDYKESWALKNWCFCTVAWEKTLESPLDCKEIQPVHPKGDQSWIFGHVMWRTDSFEKTLMLGKIEAAGEEGDDRGWDGWMASPTQWMWVWVSSGSWWWTGKPGVLQSLGSQRVRHDWVTELNWTESPEPVNDILFRKRVFADVVKNFKIRRSSWIIWLDCNPGASVLIGVRQRERRRQRQTHSEDGVKIEAETGVIWLLPRGHQICPHVVSSHQQPAEGPGKLLPQSLEREVWPYQHFGFGLLASRTLREDISAVLSHRFLFGSPQKLIYPISAVGAWYHQEGKIIPCCW